MTDPQPQWAIILGVSGGLGSACARQLARSGLSIFGVHLDSSESMHRAEEVAAAVEAEGQRFVGVNANADRASVIEESVAMLRDLPGTPKLLLHAVAFGALGPLCSTPASEIEPVTRRQLDMTVGVMATSLVSWAQSLVDADLLGADARIISLTSIGATHVVPNYGAVSAAKSALEAYCRQLACELAPRGIAVNAIRAGVTVTEGLTKIPGSSELIRRAGKYNPFGRLTTPEDVARVVDVMTNTMPVWVTGNVIGADGGEKLTI